uniref:Uncharacterized protein n=1 Tax=viral metagenome TaxID=1070528 RepID=A0A6M3MFM9_9ZZZZ
MVDLRARVREYIRRRIGWQDEQTGTCAALYGEESVLSKTNTRRPARSTDRRASGPERGTRCSCDSDRG